MVENLVITMPMLVCAFWSAVHALRLAEVRCGWSTVVGGAAPGSVAPRRALLAFLLVATVLYAGHYVYFSAWRAAIPVADSLYVAANLAVFPLYLFYIESLSIVRRPSRWWLVPSAVCGVGVAVCYALMPAAERSHFVDVYLYHGSWSSLSPVERACAAIHDVGRVVFAVLVVAVAVGGTRRLRRYDRMVHATYSDTEGKTLTRFRLLTVAIVVVTVASVVLNVAGRYAFADRCALLVVPSLFFSVLIFCLGYEGDRQTFTIADAMADAPLSAVADASLPAVADAGAATPGLSGDDLMNMLVGEKLFLVPTLKLPDVAKRLNTNRTYVSDVINRQMGMTFSELVNRLRVDHAVRLMAEHPDMALGEVAEASGFSSQMSFYRNFRQFRGCAPSDWPKPSAGR